MSLIKARTVENAKVLRPNKEHENFTETAETIENGTLLEGQEKFINGKRRGEPFTYKLFITKDKKIIYLNKVKPMENVEVLLNADGHAAEVVKLGADHRLSSLVILAGATAGFLYSRHKKHSIERSIGFAAIGAGAGFLTAVIIKKYQNKLTVKTT